MKKRHTGLKVFLWILLIVIVLPIALIYGLAYDSSGTAPSQDTSFSKDSLVQDTVASSFDNTATSGKVDFTLSQDNLNQILLLALKDKTSSIPGYEGAYIEIEDKQYVFNFKIKPIAIFATHLYLYSSLTSDDSSYIFHIDNIKIGRLGGLTDLGMNLLSKYISEESMTSMLTSTGLSLKVSYASRNITYAKADLAKDVISLMGETSSTLTGGVLSTLLNDTSLFSINFNSDKAIKASLDLKSLASSSTYSMPMASSSLNIDFAPYKSMLATLLSNGSVSTSQAEIIFNYFMFGYSSLSDSDKSVVSSCLTGQDLSSIGISNLTSYEGLNYGAEIDTDAKMNQFKLAIPGYIARTATSLGSLTEADFSSLIESMPLIGTSYLAIRKDGTAYKVNAITLNESYVNITDDHLILTLGLSFNGYNTVLVADFKDKKTSSADYKVELSLAGLSFGEKTITLGEGNAIETSLYSSLKSGMSGIDYISFDDSSKEMIIDFTSLATSSSLVSALNLANLNIDLVLKGDDIGSNGSLLFGVSKK